MLEWLTTAINGSEDAEEALTQALRGVCEITDWALGEVWTGSGERELSLSAVWWRPDKRIHKYATTTRRVRFSLGLGLPNLAWAYKRSIWLEDLQSYGRLPGARAAAAAGLRAAIATPIQDADQVVGVLVFFLSEPRQKDAQYVELVSSVAAHIEPLLRAKLAHDALRENEQRILLTLDSAYDAFVSIDPEGRIVEWNRKAEEIFGWPKRDVLGSRLVETIIPERYRTSHIQGIERYNRTGEGPVLNTRLQLSALRRNGEEFPIEITIWPISYSQRVTFSAFIRDLSKHVGVALDNLALAHDVSVPSTSSRQSAQRPRLTKSPKETAPSESPPGSETLMPRSA
jgi:PAS domain S-box-containing protein